MTRNDQLSPPRSAILVLALTAGIVVLAGCTGTTSDDARSTEPDETNGAAAAPEAVPWDEVDRFTEARRGTYIKRQTMSNQGESTEVSSETVLFDRDEGFIDRTISVPGSDELQFLYTEDGVLMRNPSVEAQCGTPWVDMGSSEDLTAAIGLDVDSSDFLTVEPLYVLEHAPDDGVVVKTTDTGTVYELALPGGTGLGMSSAMRDDPEMVETILALEHTALITVPRSSDPLIIDMNVTNLLTAMDDDVPPGMTIWTSWEVTTDTAVDTTLPTDVADAACLE